MSSTFGLVLPAIISKRLTGKRFLRHGEASAIGRSDGPRLNVFEAQEMPIYDLLCPIEDCPLRSAPTKRSRFGAWHWASPTLQTFPPGMSSG
jgi:hypothetical protein